MQKNTYNVKIIKEYEHNNITFIIASKAKISLGKIKELRGFSLQNIWLDCTYRPDGSAEYTIRFSLALTEAAKPADCLSCFLPCFFAYHKRASGIGQELHISCEGKFTKKIQSVLRPTVLKVLVDLGDSLRPGRE